MLPDRKVWERPWTVPQMHSAVKNWNLAADAGLQLYLQQFQERMLNRTSEVNQRVDDLVFAVKVRMPALCKYCCSCDDSR